MKLNILLYVAGILVIINLIYTLVAMALFYNKKSRMSLYAESSPNSVRDSREILTSYFICLGFVVLPYGIKETSTIFLHMILNSWKKRIQIINKVVFGFIEGFLFLFVYFIGLPFSIIIKKYISVSEERTKKIDPGEDIVMRL